MTDQQSLWAIQIKNRKNAIIMMKSEIKELKKLLKDSKK